MKIKAVFFGFGARSQCYANYLFLNENNFEVAAVAEPKEHLRRLAEEKYHCSRERLYPGWREMLDDGVQGDLLFICTQDNEHVEPAIAAIQAGYRQIMVEKPIYKDIEKCRQLAAAAREYGAVVQVCHSLRYNNFYRKVKEILDSGKIGQIASINHMEPVGTFHYAHSFVRGDWNKTADSPMILAKCCHDTDLLLWLTGRDCLSLSSYGSLEFFKRENAPEGCADRCIDGCKYSGSCPYSATKYLGKYKDHLFREYAVEKEGYTDTVEAPKKGRYGRCVFQCDNDVVDHQTVNLLFEDGITATLTMCAFSNFERETHIMGTMGEIRAYMKDDLVEVYNFRSGDREIYHVGHPDALHGGADTVLVEDFIASALGDKPPATSIEKSIQSHILCIAAERSRIEKRTIDLKEWI